MGTVKYSGPIASFHCPTNATIRSLKVHFSPKQEGTGDPSPDNVRPIESWNGVEVEQCQNNLFDEASIVYSRWTTGAGNIDTIATYGCITKKIKINSTSFTLIAMAERPNSMSIIEYDANGNFLRRTHGNQVQYVKINATWSSTAYIAVQISNSNGGTTITPEYVTQRKMMLVEGTDNPAAYEPYHGSTANYEFGVLGKNKFPAADGTESDIFLAANTAYTFSATSLSEGYFRGWYEDGTGTSLIWVNAGVDGNRRWKTYTPERNIIKGFFYLGTGMSECQIELGSIATAYEPYNPNRTVYGGWVDLVSGEVCETWIGCKGKDLQWENSTMSYSHFKTTIPYLARFANTGDPSVISSYYRGIPWQITPPDNYIVVRHDGYTVTVYDKTHNDTGLEALIQDLAEEDFVYELATPIVYHLAPTQFRAFLGQNNIWSNADYVEVEYDLYETQNILARKQFIIANQPHVETLAAAPLQNFVTDMAAPLKECRIYFNPVQEGEGDPSPDNVRSIMGWTGFEVYQTGKNLFDATGFCAKIPSYFSVNQDNGVHVIYPYTSGWVGQPITGYIPKGTYTLSVEGTQTNNDVDVRPETGAWYGWTASNGRQTKTLVDGMNYLLRPTNATAGDDIKIQIEVGSTVTSFSPYSGTTLSVNWADEAGTVYGGYVDFVSGKLVSQMKQVVLDGVNTQCTASYTLNGVIGAGKVLFTPQNNDDMNKVFCSNLPIYTTNPTDSFPYLYLRAVNYQGSAFVFGVIIYGLASDYPSATSQDKIDYVNNWLQDNPVQLIVPDANVEYLLTPTQLKTLKGINNIWSNTNGNIELKYWTH